VRTRGGTRTASCVWRWTGAATNDQAARQQLLHEFVAAVLELLDEHLDAEAAELGTLWSEGR
jgi:hypothetical protein